MEDIEIYALAYGGNGVGKLDGKVCFVEGALPGETVSFIKEKEKKRFVIGRAAEILAPSAERIEPKCPYYGKCGGCQYQHLRYDKEVEYKAKQVRELLRTIGGIEDFDFEGIVPSPSEYAYRSSITLHRSRTAYGYYAKDNKTIIGIDRCPLAKDEINEFLVSGKRQFKEKDVTLKCDGRGKVYTSEDAKGTYFYNEVLGLRLVFSPHAFSQVNYRVAAALAEKFYSWSAEVRAEVLFDLYCGVGFFGIPAHEAFKFVYGMDSGRAAVACARHAQKELKIKNAKFFCADTEKSFAENYVKWRGRSNVILLDPPRSGISPKLAGYLAGAEGAQTLIYISCDPAVLARDAKILTRDKAWKLERLACFDMFARTKHVESMALFRNHNR